MVENLIRQWAIQKGIVQDLIGKELKARQLTQLDKMHEEVLEFEEELVFGDHQAAVLELGDVLVCCTIQAQMLGITIEEAMQAAYDKIANRKGKTIDGVFIKEG